MFQWNIRRHSQFGRMPQLDYDGKTSSFRSLYGMTKVPDGDLEEKKYHFVHAGTGQNLAQPHLTCALAETHG